MRIIGLIIAVVVVLAILVYLGFVDVSPKGEAALDRTRENVGNALQTTGEAIRGSGN